MISVLEAQDLISRHTGPLAAESASLAEIHGRILREPVASSEDIPSFDRSAMDGYAIRNDDGAEEFEVIGEIRAGHAVDRQLQPGQAMRIFTGAPLPGPGLKVVMQEHVEAHGQRIRVMKRSAGANMRLRGEDARAGEILLKPGTLVDATAAALLASVGKASLLVTREPKVLHLTTGDEIVAPEKIPGPGQIRNSNAALVSGLFREQGIGIVKHVHAPDDLKTMVDLVNRADPESYDMVLISGGSGQGTYDFSAELFRHLGATIHFREVNVRPGKPLIFGTSLAKQIVFGLPGNALSHFVCFHLFVRPAIDHLLAGSVSVPTSAFLLEAMSGTQNARETWWPAQVSLKEGRLGCRALPWKSSGDITRLPSANALIQVPASTSHLPAGTMVNLLPTRNLTS